MKAQIRISAGLLLAAAAVASAPVAHAIDAPAGTDQPVLGLRALTGLQGGTLTIELTPGVRVLEHVHVRLLAPGATEADALNRRDVAVRQGSATINLGPVVRGTRLDVQVQVESPTSSRTLCRARQGDGTPASRPRGRRRAAPAQTRSTRPVDVVADVSELNGDTAATARLTLMLGPTPVAAPEILAVPAGETVTATFAAVQLSTPMAAELTVRVEGAAPYETDETNNARTHTVQVTKHELVRANVLVSSLGGYGAQLNQHVYAPVTNAPPASLPDMEAKVKALEPQLVRIFYNDDFEERQPNRVRNLASFVDTVQLAHEAGATINVTYQARWVTVANEPNSTQVTMAEYEALYRALDVQLVERGLREQIGLMVDLIGPAAEGWPLFPAYHALRLLLQTTREGWQVVQVAPCRTTTGASEQRIRRRRSSSPMRTPTAS